MADSSAVSGESQTAAQGPPPRNVVTKNSPPPLPIDHDLLCIGCRYNLRTKTAADRCPECGLEVAKTLAHLRENAGAIADFRAFRVAAGIFAGISIAAVPLLALRAFTESPWGGRMIGPQFRFVNVLAGDIFHIAFLALLIAGVWLVSTGISQRVVGALRTFPRVVTAIYALLGATATLGEIGRLLRFHARFAGIGRLLVAQGQPRVGTAIIGVMLLGYGSVIFRSLARAIASPRLERTSGWVFALMGFQCILPMAILMAVRIMGHAGRFFYVNPEYLFGADILAAASFAVFAWFWLALPGIIRAADGPRRIEAETGAERTAFPTMAAPGKRAAEFLVAQKNREGGSS